MNRPSITKRLSELTEKLINPNNDSRMYWAREVTFDYATSSRVRVDYMKFEPLNTTVSGIERGIFTATRLSHLRRTSTQRMGIIS